MNWKALEPDELAALRQQRAVWLRGQLDRLPGIEGPNYSSSRVRFQMAVDILADEISRLPDDPPPRLKSQWDGASAAMLGIRSTSTSGLHGALCNWCSRVDRMASEKRASKS